MAYGLAKIPLDDDEEIVFEVRESLTEIALVDAGAAERGFTTLTKTVEQQLAPIHRLLSAVAQRLAAGVSAPDELTVELALEVSAEAGLVVTKGKAGASLTVSATWKRGND